MILTVKPEHVAEISKQKIDDLVAHIQINAPDFYQRMQISEENGISMLEALYRYQRYIENGANAEETIFMFFNDWKRSNPEELDATYRVKGMASQADLNRAPYQTVKTEVSMPVMVVSISERYLCTARAEEKAVIKESVEFIYTLL